MPSWIRSVIFPGNVQQFRAQMRRLTVRLGRNGWMSAKGWRLIFGEYPQTQPRWVPTNADLNKAGHVTVYVETTEHDTAASEQIPARASWEVVYWPAGHFRLWSPQYSGIEAYEEADARTRVDFLDGYRPGAWYQDAEPIGPTFEEFCDWVIREVMAESREPLTPAGRGTGTPDNRASFEKPCQMIAKVAQAATSRSGTELTSLCCQLAEARENLRLIQERKSQYVMETDIPLQMIKEEQHLLKRIEELEQHIEELQQASSGEPESG